MLKKRIDFWRYILEKSQSWEKIDFKRHIEQILRKTGIKNRWKIEEKKDKS